MQCDLSKATTIGEARELIRTYSENNRDEQIIFGSGWKHNWPTLVNGKAAYCANHYQGTLTAQMVDDILPDKPFLCRRWDGHSLWANTCAMRAGTPSSTYPS
jgi:predicted amidohydrolase YtcJ